MSTVGDFFAMGGYATFVWSAYGVAGAVMIVIAAWGVLGLRARRATLRMLEESSER
ncbi:MAG: heme exporter protein CcmD [Alphaproteobacteria bacterium]|jgi:heme exporter protein CcmD|nr:heme exporter protein CcmD [Alphaproteobacteria bacterium]MDP6551051.1 heme exporter protein CcmD [Arenicellales bacterium]|tara:strand:- start:117 stop:284 length:168 start_codon:yes stop_codon:yes gene_type:complete